MRVVIVGAGKVGFNIADHLSSEQQDVIVIEKSQKQLKSVLDELDVQTIRGSGSSPATLHEAQISNADMIIAVTDSDEANITACMIAESQSYGITKIARIRDPELAEIITGPKPLGVKLDLVINPEAVATEKILRHISVPLATEVVSFADGKIYLLGVRIDQESSVIGKLLSDVRKENPDFLVAALSRDGKAIVPRGSDELRENDMVYVVARPESTHRALSFFDKDCNPAQKVMIYGGTIVGYLLAKHLESRGVACKVIEPDPQVSERLAEQLDKTIVLQGEGTDEELLREENIESHDCFVAVSNNEESNLFSSILAKSLGVPSTISLSDNPAYSPITPRIGIDTSVSPRMLAVSSILHYVRRGKVLAVTSFNDSDAEALEFVAMESSEIVSKNLKSLNFPKDAIIGAVVRDEQTIIPSGETVIQPMDRVVIFALKEAIPKVENALLVKLRYS